MTLVRAHRPNLIAYFLNQLLALFNQRLDLRTAGRFQAPEIQLQRGKKAGGRFIQFTSEPAPLIREDNVFLVSELVARAAKVRQRTVP
jgi:hypothetical protein